MVTTLDTAELVLTQRPDRLIMVVPGVPSVKARSMAYAAQVEARRIAPKSSGQAAGRIRATWGDGFFGLTWQDSYLWFQENGIRAFTMKSLEGKLVPMWVEDRDGSLQAKNPKIKTRVDAAGKLRVLIFRKATAPGSPGRIGTREARSPLTTAGRVGGRIARGNVGVTWRHPGLQARFFLNQALSNAARRGGVIPLRVYVADASWRRNVRLDAPGQRVAGR